jgi:signal transduction histidine kinase
MRKNGKSAVAAARGTPRRRPGTAPEGPESREFRELFTALGSATEALRQSHDELLGRVKELERELAQKNRALERKHRLEALGTIAAGVAHEIRNPLGSLALYADLLDQEIADRDRARGLLGRMRHGVTHLSTIVNDLLTFTEPGRAQAVPYDPVAVLEDSLALVAADCCAGTRIVRELPAAGRSAVGDPDWLRRIFVNLLRNAAQAMPAGGTLTVAMGYGEQIAVTIRDTGPGIAPEDLEKVFLPFWGKRHGGTGLGLPMVHSLIERHQGSIELSNNPSGGLEATVLVPWMLANDGE